MKKKVYICYLCGQQLDKKIDNDHIPPRQFYATHIRKVHSPNLFTLPVHKKCNQAYQKDEDYFVHSIAPLTIDSYSGAAIWRDILKRRTRTAGNRLHEMVFKEFDPNPSGLILPDNKVLKRFDGTRVWRVVWKITRGLFFKEYGKILPENTLRSYKIYSVGEEPIEESKYVIGTQSRGQYPAIFDYKHISAPQLNNFHLWAFLFWDKLIMQVAFHDPNCTCDKCKQV